MYNFPDSRYAVSTGASEAAKIRRERYEASLNIIIDKMTRYVSKLNPFRSPYKIIKVSNLLALIKKGNLKNARAEAIILLNDTHFCQATFTCSSAKLLVEECLLIFNFYIKNGIDGLQFAPEHQINSAISSPLNNGEISNSAFNSKLFD